MQFMGIIRLSIFFCMMIGSSLVAGDTVVRAAFDLGSGSIRMQVAEVDLEKEEIVKVLFSDARSTLIAKEVVMNGSGLISDTLQHEILTQLLDMKAHAVPFGPICFAGVATEAYRLAANGKEVIEDLSQKSGIHLELITQEEEAMYGFMTGVAAIKSNPELTVVWDIGVGSFQLSFIHEGKLMAYGAPFGRFTTQKLIIEKLRGRDYATGSSPNPLNEEEFNQFFQVIEEVLPSPSPSLLEVIKKKGEKVVRVGNSPMALRDRQSYSIKDLQSIISSYSGRADKEIPGPMPDVAVSDLFLEYAVMKKLGIQEVTRARAVAGNTTGILLTESIWKDLCPPNR